MPLLDINDPAPWFTLPSTINPRFHFDTAAGRRIVLFFFGSAAIESIQTILKNFQNIHEEFSQLGVPLFGVSIDRNDELENRPLALAPALTFFWDFEQTISTKYGVYQPVQTENTTLVKYSPKTFVLDENLRVINIFSMDDPSLHADRVLRFIKALPARETPQPMKTLHAPVLVIPNVLDADFCRSLIDLYKADGGTPSGFMREMNGKTVGILDDGFKKRRDFFIDDPQLHRKLNTFILRRVCPEVQKAYQFSITRFERYVVACYQAENEGFFKAHRDNTTKGTAHRRFAMTLNLNVGEYMGGFLKFPEYSPHGYKPGIGSAVVFSCSLLHEATPVTKGERFALLSFFYGEQDAKVRQSNQQFIVANTSTSVAEYA